MKKRKLKKWVKVVIFILVLISSCIMYIIADDMGKHASLNNRYAILCMISYGWIVLAPIISAHLLFEEV